MSPAIPLKNIKLKRAHELPAPGDGVRDLVDRPWPRGVRKVDAAIDHWMKDVASSASPRRWFGTRCNSLGCIPTEYRQELEGHKKDVDEVRDLARHGPITLGYAARDQAHNASKRGSAYVEH